MLSPDDGAVLGGGERGSHGDGLQGGWLLVVWRTMMGAIWMDMLWLRHE
jgi:hypothetical protein